MWKQNKTIDRLKSIHYTKKGVIIHTQNELKKLNFNNLINW